MKILDNMDNQKSFQKILDRALFLMSLRDHSKSELKRKLQQKFPEDIEIIENVLEELKRTTVIDDNRFAKIFTEYRLKSSPRGKNLIKQELLKKGIEQETIENVFENMNFEEEINAEELAINKAKSFDKNLDPQKKKEKLMRFLASRGFDFDIILKTIKKL